MIVRCDIFRYTFYPVHYVAVLSEYNVKNQERIKKKNSNRRKSVLFAFAARTNFRLVQKKNNFVPLGAQTTISQLVKKVRKMHASGRYVSQAEGEGSILTLSSRVVYNILHNEGDKNLTSGTKVTTFILVLFKINVFKI